MNGYEIHGKKMKVHNSFQNTRLFIGNLPKNKSRDDVIEELRKATDGVLDVIVYPDINDDKVKNRGFCFTDFDCHKNASSAKRRFTGGQAVVFGRNVVVDWAEPIQEPDNEIMSKVKVLYVKNLKEEVSEEMLTIEFSKFGPLEKVKKLKNYAFVTFKERHHALQAKDAMHNQLMAGFPLDVTLARPQSEEHQKKKEERRKVYEQQMAALGPRPQNIAQNVAFSGYPGWDSNSAKPPVRMPQRGARGGQRGFHGNRGSSFGLRNPGSVLPPRPMVPVPMPGYSHPVWDGIFLQSSFM